MAAGRPLVPVEDESNKINGTDISEACGGTSMMDSGWHQLTPYPLSLGHSFVPFGIRFQRPPRDSMVGHGTVGLIALQGVLKL